MPSPGPGFSEDGETRPRRRHHTTQKEEVRPMTLSKAQIATGALQLIAAGILLQTLFFKFTGAEESVYIFTTLGVEPWGRIASGVAELVAAALLLYPATVAAGALLAAAVMAGAILSHLTLLGIEVKGDGGLLFVLALAVFVSSIALVVIRRSELVAVSRHLGVAL
jgi:hypothetical protein